MANQIMISSPRCPICKSNDWKVFAHKKYSNEVTPKEPYRRIRHEVLFDLWFTGASYVELKSIGCKTCGFFCYSPRPQKEDLDQKYAYINSHESGSKELYTPRASDRARAHDLYCYTRNMVKGKSAKIIDYGGGDGRLLREFVDAEHNCSVIDYVDKAIPGVAYAGRDPQDAPHSGHYDLVTCSHVIEHIADPLATLLELKALLVENGHIYIEVPSEIWTKAPPNIDPVTHINFFTTDSLRTLLSEAGLEVVNCQYHAFTRPNGRIGIAVKGVARNTSMSRNDPIVYKGLDEVERLLSTTLIDRILRIARHPRMLKNLLVRAEQPGKH